MVMPPGNSVLPIVLLIDRPIDIIRFAEIICFTARSRSAGAERSSFDFPVQGFFTNSPDLTLDRNDTLLYKRAVSSQPGK